MRIQVLGTGCAKCRQLAASVEAAARELGLGAEVEKVEEFAEIMKFGVMSVPALVLDGKVAAVGRLPSREELRKLLGG
jgi:small redox-active disulfide protein 2